jgi:hypothetical protein
MLGYLTDPNGDAPPQVEVLHDMRLTLMDDPAYRVNLTDLLDRWYQYLVSWVLPRMFVAAEGDLLDRPIRGLGSGGDLGDANPLSAALNRQSTSDHGSAAGR